MKHTKAAPYKLTMKITSFYIMLRSMKTYTKSQWLYRRLTTQWSNELRLQCQSVLCRGGFKVQPKYYIKCLVEHCLTKPMMISVVVLLNPGLGLAPALSEYVQWCCLCLGSGH